MLVTRSETRSVMDCGGKRSATPLSHARRFSVIRKFPVRPKAVSPLRSATALQDAGANDCGFRLREAFWSAAALHRFFTNITP
jgi:hypothetical protein